MKSLLFHAVLDPTGWHTMRAPFVSNKTTDQAHRSREKKEGGKKYSCITNLSSIHPWGLVNHH